MRRTVCALALAGVLLAMAPTALIAAPGDSRVVSRHFRANEVVRIEGRVGVQATIGFEAGEKIENVAVGDADRWQITPNRRADLLFVKPLETTARTNMTVVTDKRTYLFDLVATPTGNPVYMLTFTYGAEPEAAAQPASFGEVMREALVDRPASATPAQAAAAVDPALLNFAWETKGAARLLPLRVYDDGRFTYLLWGAGQAEPQILLPDEKGAETPAAGVQRRGNTVVLTGVPPRIVLRAGKASATLANRNLPPAAPASAAPAQPAGAEAPAPAATAPAPAAQGS